MADDVNKSNRGPMNGFGVSEIERIGAQTYNIPKTEQEQRDRASRARTQIEAIEQLPPSMVRQNRALNRIAEMAPNTLISAEQRIRSSVHGRLERSNIMAANAIGREYSETNINSMARGMYESSAFQNQALSMMGQNFDALAGRRQDIMGQIGNLGSQATAAAGSLFTSRGQRRDLTNQIAGNAEQAGTLVKELASIDLAMKTKRQIGADPLSRFEKLNAVGERAGGMLGAAGIGEELRSGGVNISKGGQSVQVANGDISRAIMQEAEALKRVLSELANSAGKSAEELDVMRKSAEESAHNFEKLEKAQVAAGGGGGASGSQYLSAAAGGFNAIGSGMQAVMINQRMGQMANIGGFAGLANQQYDMYTKARGGDIASQLALGQFSDAGKFGTELSRATGAVQGATMAAGAAQTAAGAFQVSEAAVGKTVGIGGQLLGTGGMSTAEGLAGAQNIAQGASTMAVTGFDMARGVSAQGNRLAGINANMQARQAINAIGASQAQGLRDFYTGLDVVGQNMGGRAGGFINEAVSGGNLQRMQDARMSPEQFLKMSQLGSQNMGSTFQTSQIFGARNLERGGFGSMETNMQRMSQLAAAGANNPQAGMEGVLSAAMSKGLDSSKAISMMVENTAAMVSSNAGTAVGIDTIGASSSLLASSMNPALANKEFALSMAADAQAITRQTTTNRDVSFVGMANTAGLQQNLAAAGVQISGTESLIAQGVDIATLKSLQKDPKKAADFFRNQGVNVTESNVDTFLTTTLGEKEKQLLRPGGLAVNADTSGLLKRIKEGKVSEGDQVSLGQIAQLQGRKGGADELIREIKGVGTPNVAGLAGKELMEGKGPDDIKKQMDTLRTSGFKQLSEAAAAASDNLQKFGGALKVFTDLQQKFEEGGKANEQGFSTAASDMAKDFKDGAVTFKSSVGDFAAAVKVLSSRAGLDSNANPVKPEFMNLDQRKGSSRGN